MSRKNDGTRRRALRLALLWVGLVVACAGLARHLLALETRIRWEQDVRSDVADDMAVYPVRDPAAWAEHQHRTGTRIAALRREQAVTRALVFGVALLGLGAGMWISWPARVRPTRAGAVEEIE